MEMWKKTLIVFLIVVLFVSGGIFIYASDYYEADPQVYNNLQSESINIYDDEIIVFHGHKQNYTKKALVFYPGGKVEYTSYIPMLDKLSQEGITVVLLKMPLNLAVLDLNAAEKAFDLLPDIDSWYIGGHSLGAAMADRYVENSTENIKGLVFLAAYPESNKKIPTISIVGSNDTVLSQEKTNLDYEFLEISGGNHAYFGNYGNQKGDGKATISRDKQQTITVEAILNFISEN